LEFFGLKTVALGCIPILFWLLKLWRPEGGTLSDIRLLVASYTIVSVIVLISKWFEAGKKLKMEGELMNTLIHLNSDQQASLGVLALKGTHSPDALLDEISSNTCFLDRDFTGYFVKVEHLAFLRKWAKSRGFTC